MSFQSLIIKKATDALSPLVLKILSMDQVQNVLIKILSTRESVRENIASNIKKLTKSLKLATRDDVSQISSNFRQLEKEIRDLKEELLTLYEKEESLRKEISSLRNVNGRKKV